MGFYFEALLFFCFFSSICGGGYKDGYGNYNSVILSTVTVTSTEVWSLKVDCWLVSSNWQLQLTQVHPTTITVWNTVTETNINTQSVTQTLTSIEVVPTTYVWVSTEIIDNTQTLEHTLTATETQTQTNVYTQTATQTDTATATIQETTTNFATVTQLSTVVQPTTFTSVWVSTQVIDNVNFQCFCCCHIPVLIFELINRLWQSSRLKRTLSHPCPPPSQLPLRQRRRPTPSPSLRSVLMSNPLPLPRFGWRPRLLIMWALGVIQNLGGTFYVNDRLRSLFRALPRPRHTMWPTYKQSPTSRLPPLPLLPPQQLLRFIRKPLSLSASARFVSVKYGIWINKINSVSFFI